ncbi:MAG: response regulator transcription factor [Clostridia bacterium]|nr:response regulator transcription factor [Clostridia bacterium]
MIRIFIIEDDRAIAGAIASALGAWGYDARCAERFDAILDEVNAFAPQLILLDISLPFYNGYYWCEKIRRSSKVPILFLSSRQEEADIIMAMNMGGDDYIQKPFSMEVLTAKIAAMLRRAYDYEAAPAPTLKDAVLDAAASTLIRGGQSYPLTRNELRLLSELLANKGRIVSRERLMLKLWDDDNFIDDNTLTVNVNRLRKTLESAGFADCIVTHKGQGYAIHA